MLLTHFYITVGPGTVLGNEQVPTFLDGCTIYAQFLKIKNESNVILSNCFLSFLLFPF